MTHAGASKLFTHSHAASASAMLLYESSLPCSCLAVTSEPGAGLEVAIERGLLVRVLAVAQVLQLDEAAVRLRRELARAGAVVGRSDDR